jgi:L-alanine-DL-glutamate epimerase-like enolase superfamily enzyme
LALSASLQPYAGLAEHRICEYPTAQKSLAREIAKSALQRDENGEIDVPDAPGLGIEVNAAALQKYLVDVQIVVGGKALFSSSMIS